MESIANLPNFNPLQTMATVAAFVSPSQEQRRKYLFQFLKSNLYSRIDVIVQNYDHLTPEELHNLSEHKNVMFHSKLTYDLVKSHCAKNDQKSAIIFLNLYTDDHRWNKDQNILSPIIFSSKHNNVTTLFCTEYLNALPCWTRSSLCYLVMIDVDIASKVHERFLLFNLFDKSLLIECKQDKYALVLKFHPECIFTWKLL